MGTKDVVEKVWNQNGGQRNIRRMKESRKTFLVLANLELKCANSCVRGHMIIIRRERMDQIYEYGIAYIFVPKNKTFLSMLLRTVIAAESLIV